MNNPERVASSRSPEMSLLFLPTSPSVNLKSSRTKPTPKRRDRRSSEERKNRIVDPLYFNLGPAPFRRSENVADQPRSSSANHPAFFPPSTNHDHTEQEQYDLEGLEEEEEDSPASSTASSIPIEIRYGIPQPLYWAEDESFASSLHLYAQACDSSSTERSKSGREKRVIDIGQLSFLSESGKIERERRLDRVDLGRLNHTDDNEKKNLSSSNPPSQSVNRQISQSFSSQVPIVPSISAIPSSAGPSSTARRRAVQEATFDPFAPEFDETDPRSQVASLGLAPDSSNTDEEGDAPSSDEELQAGLPMTHHEAREARMNALQRLKLKRHTHTDILGAGKRVKRRRYVSDDETGEESSGASRREEDKKSLTTSSRRNGLVASSPTQTHQNSATSHSRSSRLPHPAIDAESHVDPDLDMQHVDRTEAVDSGTSLLDNWVELNSQVLNEIDRDALRPCPGEVEGKCPNVEPGPETESIQGMMIEPQDLGNQGAEPDREDSEQSPDHSSQHNSMHGEQDDTLYEARSDAADDKVVVIKSERAKGKMPETDLSTMFDDDPLPQDADRSGMDIVDLTEEDAYGDDYELDKYEATQEQPEEDQAGNMEDEFDAFPWDPSQPVRSPSPPTPGGNEKRRSEGRILPETDKNGEPWIHPLRGISTLPEKLQHFYLTHFRAEPKRNKEALVGPAAQLENDRVQEADRLAGNAKKTIRGKTWESTAGRRAGGADSAKTTSKRGKSAVRGKNFFIQRAIRAKMAGRGRGRGR